MLCTGAKYWRSSWASHDAVVVQKFGVLKFQRAIGMCANVHDKVIMMFLNYAHYFDTQRFSLGDGAS